MKPCLKWVGGKTQILEKLFEKFPDEINDYYEPFVGGGSVMIELIHRLETGQIKVKAKIFINDKNSDLINLYNLVKTNLPYLIKKLAKLEKIYNEKCEIGDLIDSVILCEFDMLISSKTLYNTKKWKHTYLFTGESKLLCNKAY